MPESGDGPGTSGSEEPQAASVSASSTTEKRGLTNGVHMGVTLPDRGYLMKSPIVSAGLKPAQSNAVPVAA